MTHDQDVRSEETDGQDDLIAFLASPHAFAGETVTRIDTHISHIFLAGDRSYKLKRAVVFEFLDFSTLTNREEACRREVEINQRFAPNLYLGVIPVTQTPDGKFHVNGEGQIVDWLVEMVRFDGQDQFDVLVHTDGLTPSIVSALADRIATLHKTTSFSLTHGGANGMRKVAHEIESMLSNAPHSHEWRAILENWSEKLNGEIERRSDMLDTRKRHRFVRQCHADLHLANIVLWEGQPTPFDGIEFNDDLCWIDILYDVSFPIMDLLHFDQKRLANLLLNRYLEVTRDYGGLVLLPIFLSLRAAIRSMANAMNPADTARDKARQYLMLASTLINRPKPGRLIATSGFSGTGKSTLAKSLAVELVGGAGAVVLSSDAIRKRMLGRKLTDRLGPDAYTQRVSDQVYRRIIMDARRSLLAGQTVIADATFLDPHWRHALQNLAESLGVPFSGLWLEAPGRTLEIRLSERKGDVSDADFSIASAQMANAQAPNDWHRVDTTGGKAATFTRALETLLRLS